MIKNRSKYRKIYQLDLAEEITGVNRKIITQRARRNSWTLVETILAYLKEKSSY